MQSTYTRSMASWLLVAGVLTSVTATAKPSVCSPAYEQQIRATYFDGGAVSKAKVEATIARLKQKKVEIADIIEGREELKADERGKDVKENKVRKAIDKSKSLLALSEAIAAAESMKSALSFAQICDAAVAISDLEGAVKFEGEPLPLAALLKDAKSILSTWKIPKASPANEEASNLTAADGSVLSADDIAALKARGVDLSTLQPAKGSSFYVPVANISSVDVRQAALGSTIPMYAGLSNVFPANPTFIFDGMKKSNTKPKMEAVVEGRKDAKFKLKFEAEYHADPIANAILMTLGFPGDLSKYQKSIRVVLPKDVGFMRDPHTGKKIKVEALSALKREWESYFSRDRLRGRDSKIESLIESTSKDAQGNTVVVFKEGMIEAHPDALKRIGGWKYSDGDHNSRREVRGMTLVHMWLANADIKEFDNNDVIMRENSNGTASRLLINSDVGYALGGLQPENLSLYQRNMIRSTSGSTVDFTYFALHPLTIKHQITMADARWAARLIAQLTRAQITQAVALGGMPDCVQQAFVERMIARRNDLLSGLGLIGAKQADGTTIALMPQGDSKTFDIENICKWDEGGKAETAKYGFSVGSFLGPVLVGAKRQLVTIARTALGGEKRIVLRSKDFKWGGPRPIAEILLNVDRKIERNPAPKTEQDLFIVKDILSVGIRAGVTVGPYADVVERISWEMAYGARSQAEAAMNNGFIVNLLLPRDARVGNLPESYVLKTEHSFEVGSGIQLDNLQVPLSPVIQAGGGTVRAWRSIYDHRDLSKAVLYRDRQDYSQAELDVFVRLAVLKIPVLEQIKTWGNALGKGVVIPAEELKKPEIEAAVDKAIIEGDFASLASRETDFFTTDAFQHSLRKWNLLVWRGSSEKRLDRIQIDTDDDKNVVQFKTTKGSTVSVLTSRVEKNIAVEVYADPASPQELELAVNIMGTDVKTSDEEMEKKYLRFINGLSIDGKPVINLTPSLGYTVNGNWGNTLTQSSTTYTIEGMKRILTATPEQFWNALASSMKVSRAQIDAWRSGADRTHAQDVAIDHAKEWIRNVAKASSETKLEKRIAKLAEAVRKAVFLDRAGFYNPAVLGALNRLAGEANFYSRNLITVPSPGAINLPEGTPAFGRIGTPLKSNLKYLIYAPVTAVDLYTMFDTWF